MKVSELEGVDLAYWIAIAEDLTPFIRGKECYTHEFTCSASPVYDGNKCIGYTYAPHESWGQGGPLISKHNVALYPYLDGLGWYAHTQNGRGARMEGLSPLQAAMRSIIATMYGKDISVARTKLCYLPPRNTVPESIAN